jgi:hypothetical protein
MKIEFSEAPCQGMNPKGSLIYRNEIIGEEADPEGVEHHHQILGPSTFAATSLLTDQNAFFSHLNFFPFLVMI